MALFDVIQPRMCELGKIKIGKKEEQVRKSASGEEWRAPSKLDHFVVTTLGRNAKGDLIEDESIMDSLGAYKDKDGFLRQIPIAVLSNDIEEIMQASFVWYIGKNVAARSDGITLTKLYDAKEKKWLDTPEECEWNPEWADLADDKGVKRFKRHTIFNCIVAAGKSSRFGGFYKFRTTSVITASQLAGSLLEIKQLTGGILRGVPLRLTVRPMQVSPQGKTTTVYVVHAELVGEDLTTIQTMALERARLELSTRREIDTMQIEYRRLLLPPGHESPLEQADVSEEFHPEQLAADSVPPVAVDPLVAAFAGLPVDEPEEPEVVPTAPPKPVVVEPVTADKSEPDIVLETMDALTNATLQGGDGAAILGVLKDWEAEFEFNCEEADKHMPRIKAAWYCRAFELAGNVKDYKRLREEAGKVKWPEELQEKLSDADRAAAERLKVRG